MLHALATFWLLAAPPGPAADSSEAVCALRGLFVAQKAHYGERDRYSALPSEVGFAPDACADGTQALSAHPAHARGCHFIYRVATLGPDAQDFRAEALGVTGPWQGARFELRSDGRVLRADGSPVQATCTEAERWRTPLARVFEVMAERDCLQPPASASDPCDAALRDTVRLANAGMGLAQRLYATRPFARALGMREPSTPFIELCAADDRPEAKREQAAVELSRHGALAEAVLSSYCSEPGVRTGLRRLLASGAVPCPGTPCLPLLALARSKHAPEHARVLETHARPIAAALMALPGSGRATAISAVLGHSQGAAAALADLLEGRLASTRALPAPESDPVTARLILEAERVVPPATPALRASRELARDGALSEATFFQLLPADCADLERALPPRLPTAQLLRLSREAARCPDVYLSRLEPGAARLPAANLPALLGPLGPERRARLRDKLGLHEPARAEALVAWVVEQAPELLPALHITPRTARQLLQPAVSSRLGGKPAMLEALIGSSSTASHPQIDGEAYDILAAEAPWPLPPRAPRVTPRPAPAWKPTESGRFGLLRLVEARGGRHLFVQTPGSSAERPLTMSGRVSSAQFAAAPVAISPDRRWVAYTESTPPSQAASRPLVTLWNTLHVVRADGTGHRMLVELGAPAPGAARREAGTLVWSDDGTRLAYAVHTLANPDAEEACPSTELFEVQVASGAVRPLSHPPLRGRVRLLRWRSTPPELVLEGECGPEVPPPPGYAEPPPRPVFAAWLDLGTGRVQRRSGSLSLSPDGAEAFLGPDWQRRAPGIYEDAGAASEPRLPFGLPRNHEAAPLWLHRSPSVLVSLSRRWPSPGECEGAHVPEPTLVRYDLATGIPKVLWRARRGVQVLSLSPDDAWALVRLLTGAREPGLMCGPVELERLYAVRLEDLQQAASLRALRARAVPLTPPHPQGEGSAGYLGWVRTD